MINNRPLVCRFGALGDMVMITPLLKRLYERSGLPVDIISVGGYSEILFQNMPYVNNVYSITSRKAPYLFNASQKKIVRLLKQQSYENTWICESNKKSNWLLKKGGISEEKSISAMASPRLIDEHFVDYWIRLADMSPLNCNYGLLDASQPADTMLFVTNDEIQDCQDWLLKRKINHDKPLVCIQAGNKRTTRSGSRKRASNVKYWPESNWATVINSVFELLPNAQILLCGTPAEKSLTLEIKNLCNYQDNIFSVADDLPIRRLMALISISHSFISVDTGPAHIAAALDCPLTVLFGKSDARVYSPKSNTSNVSLVIGRNPEVELVAGEKSWRNAHDMTLITPDDVVSGWQKSLIG